MLAKQIVSALGCLALALVNAGATIRCRLCTLESYLRAFEEMTMTKHLLPSAGSKSEEWNNRCIMTTYEIPFNDMKGSPDQASIDAIELLHVFAFLHSPQVPEAVFRNA